MLGSCRSQALTGDYAAIKRWQSHMACKPRLRLGIGFNFINIFILDHNYNFIFV